jgi:tetratricopeptide (TPR) repeat protein
MKPFLTTLFCAFLLVFGALSESRAAAQGGRQVSPAAADHLARGLKLYEHDQFDEAIAELRAGYAIDPHPDFLYALGQAERKRGDCKRAVEYYESCLAFLRDPAAARAVQVQIERCRAQDVTPPPVTPLPPPVLPPATPPPATPPPVVTAPRPVIITHSWYRDPAGGVLVGTGVAALAAGGALVGIAHARGDDAANGYQQYADARNAPALWTGGIVTIAVGGALVLAGVLRYGLHARHKTAPASTP